jgi:hypothetical protein
MFGKPEGKTILGRPRRKWDDVIEIVRKEIDWEVLRWINLSKDRDRGRLLLNTVINLQVS